MEHGPVARLPLPGDRSSLVWVQNRSDATVSRRAFAHRNRRCRGSEHAVHARQGHGRRRRANLASVEYDGERLGKDRIALVCELKAQDFNLRLRDITCR